MNYPRQRQRLVWTSAYALFTLLVGACSNGDEKALQAIREQTKGKKFIPLGQTSKLLLPDLKAKAKEHPDDFQTQFDLAQAASEAQDWDTALQAAEAATRLDPKSVPAKEIYAQCLHQSGRLGDASAQWEAIVASGETHKALDDVNLANMYKMQGRLAEAERLYLKALEAGDETHGLVYPNLADLQIKLEKYDEATKTLKEGLEKDPKALYLHHLLGLVAFSKSDFTTAIAEFNHEIERRGGAWELYFLIGLSEGRLQPPQLDKAEEALAKATELRPSDAAYFKASLADLYVDAGQTEKGKTLATEALAEMPVFREDQLGVAYHALAKAYLKLGDQAQAKEFHDKFQQGLAKTESSDPEQRRRIREMDSLFGGR